MRKWMRDRLQGRKKKPAETSDQPAPPPLQPAYFDTEQERGTAADSRHVEEERSEPAPAAADAAPIQSGRAESEESPADDQSRSSQQAPRSAGQAGRGRRRRGGRGRGGRGREQAVAQAFAPAAVKGSIPGEQPEAGEEELSGAGEQGTQRPARPTQPRSVAPPRAAASPTVPSSPKGVVVLAIGLPGSGKSSWFKRHNVVPLSSDLVRSLLFDDVREQRFQDLVFSNLRSMLKARLIAKRPMNYVDATNLTPQERQRS
jgi:hypothetical protein